MQQNRISVGFRTYQNSVFSSHTILCNKTVSLLALEHIRILYSANTRYYATKPYLCWLQNILEFCIQLTHDIMISLLALEHIRILYSANTRYYAVSLLALEHIRILYSANTQYYATKTYLCWLQNILQFCIQLTHDIMQKTVSLLALEHIRILYSANTRYYATKKPYLCWLQNILEFCIQLTHDIMQQNRISVGFRTYQNSVFS